MRYSYFWSIFYIYESITHLFILQYVIMILCMVYLGNNKFMHFYHEITAKTGYRKQTKRNVF